MDGAEIMLRAEGPAEGSCLPAIVVMPPGLQSGTQDIETEWSKRLSGAGYWVFHWDPRGRGDSSGKESANGLEGASDAASILRWVSSLTRIDSTRISVFSRSFGGALAAGALGRFTDLKPNIWFDYESPGWLLDDIQYLDGYGREQMEHLSEDEQWWVDRSPAYWAPNVNVPYFRMQGIPDHAQGARMEHLQSLLRRIGTDQRFGNGEVISKDSQLEEPIEWLYEGGLDVQNISVTDWIIEEEWRYP
jgi:pimeloyl-ACP methyl ester carboxylesterase